jgi:hypothetical protein
MNMPLTKACNVRLNFQITKFIYLKIILDFCIIITILLGYLTFRIKNNSIINH